MGLSNWEIRLYKDSGANVGVLEADDVLVDTMLTAAADDPETPIVEDLGMYWFRVPDVPGNYIIVEVMQDGWEQTAPVTSVTELADLGADGYAFSLTEGAVLIDRDFGNKESAVIDEPLTAIMTATGSWDRTVTWDLTKSVDPASHEGYAGDSFDSVWTVVADKTDSGPQNFVVEGEITIYNTNDIDSPSPSPTPSTTLGGMVARWTFPRPDAFDPRPPVVTAPTRPSRPTRPRRRTTRL